MSRRILVAVLIVLMLSVSLPVSAKIREVIKEDYDVLWSAAVRLIRVDKDWVLTDKDKDTGFIIFRYRAKPTNESRATIEILADKSDSKKTGLRWVVQVSIPAVSSIEERMLISDLKSKLREER